MRENDTNRTVFEIIFYFGFSFKLKNHLIFLTIEILLHWSSDFHPSVHPLGLVSFQDSPVFK